MGVEGACRVRPAPDLPGSFVAKRGRAGGFERIGATTGEMGFDPHPAGGIIGIVRWQSPEAMQVIGQNHHRVDTERMPLFDGGERFMQQSHHIRFAKNSPPPVGHDREEVCCAGGG